MDDLRRPGLSRQQHPVAHDHAVAAAGIPVELRRELRALLPGDCANGEIDAEVDRDTRAAIPGVSEAGHVLFEARRPTECTETAVLYRSNDLRHPTAPPSPSQTSTAASAEVSDGSGIRFAGFLAATFVTTSRPRLPVRSANSTVMPMWRDVACNSTSDRST